MREEKKKGELHPRNPHRGRYDLIKLIETCPQLEEYVAQNRYGDLSIDFFDPMAVKVLNRALLAHYYDIDYWDIPDNALTPPIPGRADYIHHIADLIPSKKGSKSLIFCLDIGVGANCIYPIIGCSEYGWRFVGSDVDRDSLSNAQMIIDNNTILHGAIELRHQSNRDSIFDGVILAGDRFDLTICNPPFHDSAQSAEQGTLRKLRNLKGKRVTKATLNFGGSSSELWCKGGELRFITNMICESRIYMDSCRWFTTLVSNEDNLKPLIKELSRNRVKEHRVIQMSQGNKKSRILAWRYH